MIENLFVIELYIVVYAHFIRRYAMYSKYRCFLHRNRYDKIMSEAPELDKLTCNIIVTVIQVSQYFVYN